MAKWIICVIFWGETWRHARMKLVFKIIWDLYMTNLLNPLGCAEWWLVMQEQLLRNKRVLLPQRCAAEQLHSFVLCWWKGHLGTRVLLRRKEMSRSPHISSLTARYVFPPHPTRTEWLHDGYRSLRHRPGVPGLFSGLTLNWRGLWFLVLHLSYVTH